MLQFKTRLAEPTAVLFDLFLARQLQQFLITRRERGTREVVQFKAMAERGMAKAAASGPGMRQASFKTIQCYRIASDRNGCSLVHLQRS